MRSGFSIPLSIILFTINVLSIEFINSSPSTSDGAGHFDLNPVYVVGSTITVQWTPVPEGGGAYTSLIMWQQKGAAFQQPFEPISLGVISNHSSFTWTVSTKKDLGISNTFFLSLIIEQSTAPAADSQFFNITTKVVGNQPTTSGASPATSSATDVTISAVASAAAHTSSPSSTAFPSAGSNGLSKGAKVGLGVGIPAAILLGISVG